MTRVARFLPWVALLAGSGACSADLTATPEYASMLAEHQLATNKQEGAREAHEAFVTQHNALVARDAPAGSRLADEVRTIEAEHTKIVETHAARIDEHRRLFDRHTAFLQKVATGEVTSLDELRSAAVQFSAELAAVAQEHSIVRSEYQKVLRDHAELSQRLEKAEDDASRMPTKGPGKNKKGKNRAGKKGGRKNRR